ncbi:hypothetical protein DEO72_LG9g98 [Vigna unguiculata]|uniref:Uncharacterized protein n=1 Tax=Vigna unguiculata TaxID=3917 RepID=A0A4D6MVF9_VIGUN|nr:hypothetical protein DEO72_LG9g98 [Vigna unguiculata]
MVDQVQHPSIMDKVAGQLHLRSGFSSGIKSYDGAFHHPAMAFCVSSSHSASPSTLTQTQNLSDPPIVVPEKKRRVKASDTQFKENWLASLSYPFPEKTPRLNSEHDPTQQNDGSKWVLGIDPDVSVENERFRLFSSGIVFIFVFVG